MNDLLTKLRLMECIECRGSIECVDAESPYIRCINCGKVYPVLHKKVPVFIKPFSELGPAEQIELRMLEKHVRNIFNEDFLSNPYNERRVIIDKLLPEEGLMLDIGGSDGQYAEYFMQRHPKRDFLVIDKSHVWLELRKNIAVPYALSDLYNLPFRDNIFDAVFIGEVLEHLLSPEICLRTACSKLKPGGYILGTVPNFFFFTKRIKFMCGKFSEPGEPPLSHEHIRFFSKEILYNSLKKIGLSAIDIYGFYPPSLKKEPCSSIFRKLSPIYPSLFAMLFVFKAKKPAS